MRLSSKLFAVQVVAILGIDRAALDDEAIFGIDENLNPLVGLAGHRLEVIAVGQVRDVLGALLAAAGLGKELIERLPFAQRPDCAELVLKFRSALNEFALREVGVAPTSGQYRVRWCP